MALDGLMDAIADRGWYVWDDFWTHKKCKLYESAFLNVGNEQKLVETKRFSVLRISGAIKSNGLIYQWGNLFKTIWSGWSRSGVKWTATFSWAVWIWSALCKIRVGDFYLKHLDSFRGNENRKLTTVFYLNENWTPADGGELKSTICRITGLKR